MRRSPGELWAKEHSFEKPEIGKNNILTKSDVFWLLFVRMAGDECLFRGQESSKALHIQCKIGQPVCLFGL